MTITEPVQAAPAPRVARLDRPAVVALILGIAGFAYRVWLVVAHVPLTNSDEATMGLAALHISTGRGFPAFFYGQAYMGTLEAYLATPLFALFGPSTVALRVPALLLYAAFVVGAYLLTRRLYTPWLAVVVVGALALGADRVIKDQLISAGGYPEISPGATLLLLLSVWLGTGVVRPRPLAYAGWGFVAGLLIWDDWLVLPYVAAAAVVLLVGCWRALRGPGGRALALATAGGVVLGAAPLLIHNLTGSLRDNSLAVFLRQSGSEEPVSIADRLYGGIVFGIPMGTGMCSPGRCAPWQMWWAVAFLVLLGAAAVLAVRGLRRAATHADRVREAARLGLVAAAALSIAAYARSSPAGQTPVESARYLSCLLISLPAVLWPLWVAATAVRSRLRAGLAAAPIVALLATMLFATAAHVAHAPEVNRQDRARRALADHLVRENVTHIYADYWTCNLVAFATVERVVCAVIGDDLHPGYDRYAPYRTEVGAAERPAYVLPAFLPLDARVATWLAASGVPYETTTVAGYHIYRPARRVPLPMR